MFDKARHTTINGGTFTQHTHLPQSQSNTEPALIQLLQHSAPTAAYDAQAHPPCHPGTPALRTVSEWMFSPRSSRKPLLWLHGPSQALNSAIAKHVATKCALRGELTGNFFFSSQSARPKQNSIAHFVPTLALQLALSPLRGFQPGLLRAMHEGPPPPLIRQPIPTQVERLLLEPLQGGTAPGPFLIVIDALDQCDGKEDQHEILAQLARIVQGPQNPLRIIVTSASAPHLRCYFKSNKLAVSSRMDVVEDSLHQAPNAGLFEAHKLINVSRARKTIQKHESENWEGNNLIVGSTSAFVRHGDRDRTQALAAPGGHGSD
ncbi:hypothetical protein DXG01_005985 [Tephrocybe rancida]|nr:hypothetical protein DXG01_005985 [Tephrocybe rancida]